MSKSDYSPGGDNDRAYWRKTLSKLHILITGATGQQGGSVLRSLEGKGHELYALTRNVETERAKDLASRGIHVLVGDLHDPATLETSFSKVGSVFLVGTPFQAGTDGETQMGINAADAAKKAGVEHLVYSSVADADKKTRIPHFDSKYKVEEYIRQSGVPFTILAPAFFYDNMTASFNLPSLRNGVFAQALSKAVKLQMVSTEDIGKFSAVALENRDKFLGKRIDYAGDELTGPEIAKIVERASGRKINFVELPTEQVRESSEDMALMYEWFSRVGYSADIEKLKREYPEVGWETFTRWALRQNWDVLVPTPAH